MKSFESFIPNRDDALSELKELEHFLNVTPTFKEREAVLPFFKDKKNLAALMGMTNPKVAQPDKVANELSLFGDFVCDAGAGDSSANAYTLIEFEGAEPNFIFSPIKGTRPVRGWASRFEHGFSQLVDWAWRLDEEHHSGTPYRNIFGKDRADVLLLLVIGRRSDLSQDDIDRLNWRSDNISLGKFKMACWTFDELLANMNRRLRYKDEF